MRTKASRCQRLVKSCYDWKSALVCAPAEFYCWTLIEDIIGQELFVSLEKGFHRNFAEARRNVYDIRKPCNYEKFGTLCYEEAEWTETWLNLPAVKASLGVDPSRQFRSW